MRHIGKKNYPLGHKHYKVLRLLLLNHIPHYISYLNVSPSILLDHAVTGICRLRLSLNTLFFFLLGWNNALDPAHAELVTKNLSVSFISAAAWIAFMNISMLSLKIDAGCFLLYSIPATEAAHVHNYLTLINAI